MDKYNRITMAILIVAATFVALGSAITFGLTGDKYESLSSAFLLIGSALAFTIPVMGPYFAHKREQELKKETINVFKSHLNIP